MPIAPLLDPKTVAQILGVSQRTLRRYCEERRIGFHDEPGGRMFSEAQVRDYLRLTERPARSTIRMVDAAGIEPHAKTPGNHEAGVENGAESGAVGTRGDSLRIAIGWTSA